MLIDGLLNIAVRCGDCGKVELHRITLFELKSKKGFELHCVCGAEKLSVTPQHNKMLQFSIPCDICTNSHAFWYSFKELIDKERTVESCPVIGTNLFWIGDKAWIHEEISYRNNFITNEIMDKGSYFNSPHIMLDILEWLYGLKEKESIKCECGCRSKDIGMNLFPDRVELYCRSCTSLSVIYAETEEDLRNLLKADKIIMHEKTFACIDSINFNTDIKNK